MMCHFVVTQVQTTWSKIAIRVYTMIIKSTAMLVYCCACNSNNRFGQPSYNLGTAQKSYHKPLYNYTINGRASPILELMVAEMEMGLPFVNLNTMKIPRFAD